MSTKTNRRKLKWGLVFAIILIAPACFFVWRFAFHNSEKTFDTYSPKNDLAFNDGTFKYPCPMESDPGWGEAVFPWHIVDGIRERGNYWAYGLAFTGGKEGYQDSCGWRQATIDFGELKKFNRVVIWHAGDNTNISVYYLRSWNEKKSDWDTLLCRNDLLSRTEVFRANRMLSVPVEDTFKTVVSNKVQYLFNNCQADHGWINEFEVYYDEPQERPKCLIVK